MTTVRILISLLILSLSSYTSAQEIHLFGFQADSSAYAKNSYTVLFNAEEDIPTWDGGVYEPYFTLAVVRDGEKVELLIQNYLIVPTNQGFVYITQQVDEIPNDTTNIDPEEREMLSFMFEYTIGTSRSLPRIFQDKQEIKHFIRSQQPEFAGAISTEYEAISFVTPDFYITEGFNSEVHGGASWFDATEKTDFIPLSSRAGGLSNYIDSLLPRRTLNEIILKAALEIYGSDIYGSGESDENYQLPWGPLIKNKDDVQFTFVFANNRIKVQPLIPLNGNSHRSFLERAEFIDGKSILSRFFLKQPAVKTDKALDFVSADNTTLISISGNEVTVYDKTRNKLLLKKNIPTYNKLVMHEWATGKHTRRWIDEFKSTIN
ncbi:hypothetical protein [Dysgonomonas macrotermitis]|uniref:TolB-like 6-blade propeller-like n=1 Tax=Dysgonomonas macrotermitis TaxID=1346286 RepID=A0A1M4ZD72_9BACT|nr:hypothetical protein [Dysgonomonas macrotermitis]SHF15999.1 hypothetical protein SAMN05444362_10455 [Dysgonomonas macrotermitis]